MTTNPKPITSDAQGHDVLSDVLRSIRLSGSVQFCFVPAGHWQTGREGSLASLAGRANPIPFHIVVEGSCWLKMEDREIPLEAGMSSLFLSARRTISAVVREVWSSIRSSICRQSRGANCRCCITASKVRARGFCAATSSAKR